jgi:hypothetical protein
VRRRLRAAPPRAAAASGGFSGGRDPALTVSFDNAGDARSTIINVKASNRPGVLHAITTTFKDLALSVNKAEVDMDGDLLSGARPFRVMPAHKLLACLWPANSSHAPSRFQTSSTSRALPAAS